MKAIILARVSTEEQREAGNSLPAQIERLKRYCERKEFQIIHEYSFDESAYKTRRDEFDALLEEAEKMAQKEKVAVCFDKVDRLSRSVFDKRVARLYELAVEDKIELHFVSDGQVISSKMSAVEKFQFGMSLGLAKYYSDAISDNTRRAFEQKRRVGEWTGPVRIGYKHIPLDIEKRTRKDIEVDPERAPLVQRLFELYATSNYSITKLWREANRMGLRGLKGQKLSRSNIERILKDTFYYGVAYSPKYNLHYPHRYQAIITKELFDRCQAVLAGRRKMPSQVDAKPFIFRGLLPCKRCGCLYSFELKKKPSGKVYIIGSCTNAKGICKKEYVNENNLLKPVQEVFEAFESIPREVQDRLVNELRALNEGQAAFHDKAIARIRAEYDRVETRKRNLLDIRLDMSITKDEYDKKLQELSDEQHRLNIELEEYTKADHQYHIHVNTVLNLSRNMREIFESSEPAEKRQFLGLLLQNPTVSGKKLQFTLRKPFDTVLQLAHHPNELPG
ncbi:MAG TPA: recombinase family protein [Candidatus Paceibacterota bacterium]